MISQAHGVSAMAPCATFLLLTIAAAGSELNPHVPSSATCSVGEECPDAQFMLLQTEMKIGAHSMRAASAQDVQIDERFSPDGDDSSAFYQTGMKLESSAEPATTAKPKTADEIKKEIIAKKMVHPKNRAEAEGVTMNAEGDLNAFVTAVFVAIFGLMTCVSIFIVIRKKFPMVFSYKLERSFEISGGKTVEFKLYERVTGKEGQGSVVGFTDTEVMVRFPSGTVSLKPEEVNKASNPSGYDPIPAGFLGPLKAAWAIDTQSVMNSAGLDQAMVIEYCNTMMKIAATIGIPMFFIAGPVNCLFGGHRAGKDYLSYLSFGNVVNGSQLYWMHALIVWAVVFVVNRNVLAAQANFMKFRHQWLRELPKARANTVLVEGIPEDYQSDEQLIKFFETMYGDEKITAGYVVKKAPELESLFASRDSNKKALAKATFLRDKKKQKDPAADTAEDQEKIEGLIVAIDKQESEIRAMQQKVKDAAQTAGPAGGNTASGFVTFANRSDATFALSVQYSDDAEEWVVSTPPAPESVLWKDLQLDGNKATGMNAFGYVLVGALFLTYMPLVVGITQIAVTVNMGPFQAMWQAMAPTLGLQIMVAFLPTFLIMIFRGCFTLKDDAWAQQVLQNWYFVFNVVFVILVTALGGSVREFATTIAESPFKVFPLLGSTMPYATHFYMNYMAMQWMSHGTVLLRIAPCAKFLLFRQIYDDKTANEMAEPEDQDYYGIGSRSARMTTNALVGIVYGTLCPPMLLLTFVEFFVCRIIYGYLLPFAESRKSDLGGQFWVQQLRHFYVGSIIYCIMMAGVLVGRASTKGPGFIAGSCLFYIIWCMKKFERAYLWEQLPFKELMELENKNLVDVDDESDYVQPMLQPLPKK